MTYPIRNEFIERFVQLHMALLMFFVSEIHSTLTR